MWNQVQIPKLDERSKKPVVVVDLGAFFEGKENLIPDPFIVVLKAAASWSTFHSQDLFILNSLPKICLFEICLLIII